ncbi:MAG: hypothetical protein E7057_07225 [Lentisphaerae bacterium]|nr:hypothetical protein [Lentisphaerota bacterium]
MKRALYFSVFFLLIAGCASSDRMFRMSGGVLDEYSAPKTVRVRSAKYQKLSNELSSAKRANKVKVAGMDDTLVNIWPFFFRSNDYWTILWPMIDKDPYGFAFRPFYNHEGDDYSILFPLTAWNPADGHGWVTLFGWNKTGFGLVPLTWQWKETYSGGAYYTPLFIYEYDNSPLHYTVDKDGDVSKRWSRKDKDLFICLAVYTRNTAVKSGKYQWLYNMYWSKHNSDDITELKNEWNYRFKGKKPFPADRTAFENCRAEIFKTLHSEVEKTYGFLPLWIGSFSENGDYENRFLLLAGNAKKGDFFSFDLLGPVFGSYTHKKFDALFTKSEKEFCSVVLLSYFCTEERYKRTGKMQIFHDLRYDGSGKSFNQRKPEIVELLKKLDPALTLPPEVVDNNTLQIFIDELRAKYDLPTYKLHSGRILPLFWYKTDHGGDRGYRTIVPLLTWWGFNGKSSYFTSLPLMTFIKRSPEVDKTTIMTPLTYYAKSTHRKRSDYPIFSSTTKNVEEYQCAELRDQYAACGLFYRGKFGFNIAKDGINAHSANELRKALNSLPHTWERLTAQLAGIEKDTKLNDQWQTDTEIQRLEKLIRYEELKIARTEYHRALLDYRKDVETALKHAKAINFQVDKAAFSDTKKAEKALAELMEQCSTLRFYEDIGNGLFFRKEKYYNGDNNWRLLFFVAGGEKSGDRESTHILHLLYRYRKEGKRSERIIFPFISSVQDGEDSKVSFMWRVFSLSKRQGKTGGHILFIPFGSEW